MTYTHAISTNAFGPAAFIVDATASNGTHTTIASALTAAVSGQTIFIKPGTYTENITLKAGVNLTAYGSDSSLNGTGTVVISGTCSFSSAGSVTISGIQLQTNSAALLSVTGSAASIVNLNNCYLNCTNNSGVTFSTSNASAQINMNNCAGNLGTTGIAYLSDSSTGQMNILSCNFLNTGASTTASTKSAGRFYMNTSVFANPITYSSSNTVSSIFYSNLDTGTNTTNFTTSGTGTVTLVGSYFSSGSASGVSIGAGTTVTFYNCRVTSTNTNPITGAGTINIGTVDIPVAGVINTTTKNAGGILATGGISFDGGTNVLSIFTQGTFSPTIRGSGTAGSVNMTTQIGRYQKIGRYCTISFQADWSTLGGATGAVQCNNLPFTSSSSSSPCPSLITATSNAIALGTNAVGFTQVNTNAATFNVNYYIGSATTGNSATTITATNGFMTCLTYETA